LVLKEEAFHLLLAALVGIIGGSVNLFFFYAGETVQRLFLPQPIDPVQAAETFAPWQRLVGSLSRAQMLAIFSEAIAEKSKPGD